MAATTTIFDFPEELLDAVLSCADPKAVAAFAQTSRSHRTLVYDAPTQHLWRALYLAYDLDDPRRCVDAHLKPLDMTAFDWKSEVHRVVRASTVVESPRLLRRGELASILETLLALCNRFPIQRTAEKINTPKSVLWVTVTLFRYSFIDNPELPALSARESQLLARLHTMYGLTERDKTPARRVRSRAYVYDMRRYTEDNRWGPFMSDGSGNVDWELMCELHHTLSMHVVDYRTELQAEAGYSVFPMSLPFCQPLLSPGEEQDEQDWAGVTGQWRVSFAFCDHRELLVFNTFRSADDPPDTAVFEDPDFAEAFHALDMTLTITTTKQDLARPAYPKIFFEGQLSTASQPTIRGCVQMNHEGNVNWHFTSGEVGHAIWSSEGVQVGGLRSSFGVLGIWTTIFHDEHDPVGPFWLTRLRKHSQ